MWKGILASLILFIVGFNANGQSYNIDNAPWSDETFEVCDTPNTHGLRAVIFEPKIERGTKLISVTEVDHQLYPAPNEEDSFHGFGETFIRFTREVPASFIYLKEQRVAYLNSRNQWVDTSGLPLKNVKEFEYHQGDRETGAYEIFHPDEYPDMDHEAWDAKNKAYMDSAPNCSSQHVMGPMEPVIETVVRDYGRNNPLVCSDNGTVVHGDTLNDTYKAYRYVVKHVHGEGFYVKGPDGEVHAFYGLQYSALNISSIDPDGVCDWKVNPIIENLGRGLRGYPEIEE